MSTERIIVASSAHDAFISSLQSQHLSASTPKTFKLASSVGVKRVTALVTEALESGAKLVIGKDQWPVSQEMIENAMFPSLVLSGVTNEMRIWSEETFSPVCVIASTGMLSDQVNKIGKGSESGEEAEEEEAIVALANDSDYGLAASIYSKDTARAMKIGRKLECGMIRINLGTIRDDPAVSFGGYKDTGFGRFNGVDGLRGFTQVSWRKREGKNVLSRGPVGMQLIR